MEIRREEFLDYMTFKQNTRPLFTEIFGPIIGLKEEWQAQGATAAELDLSAFKFRRHMTNSVPVNTGWLGGHQPRIIEETDEHIIGIDQYGRREKLSKGSASIPLPLDYPVKTMDDWLKLKEHYLFSEERFTTGWEQAAQQALAAGQVVTLSIPGGFDEPRQLLGEEEICVSYYTQPEMIHDMLKTIRETACQVIDRVTSKVTVDMLFVHEDMAGKSGPLAGPKQIEEFIGPYYRKVWDLASSRGVRLFNQDSDGNMAGVIPAFLDTGLNMMHPAEPAAGMDLVKLRAQYGTRLAFMGGIDKHVLRKSKEEIEAELEYKIPPLVATGGCVLGLDHRIPNGTPLENYRFYIDQAWEIMNREAEKFGD
jgi:hypothetical protein